MPQILRNFLSNKDAWSYTKVHVGTNYITKATSISPISDSWFCTFHELYPVIQKVLKDTKYETPGASLSYLLSEEFQPLIPKKNNTVLSHNDISITSIMHTDDNNPTMHLIDYEYC